MLGRLGRWLRVLGYDAEDAGGRDDDALLRVAESERRMLLTRDTRFVERRAVRRGSVSALLVLHDHLTDQLRQLHEELGITQVGPPRCLVCNSALVNIEREQARGLVPEYVYRTQSRFRYCPHCDRVVWPGTHWQEMRRVLSAQGIISADPSWKG
ncbi:MAG: Mut7-C RNAse domain-containing protein [Thermoleophilia bacterium]